MSYQIRIINASVWSHTATDIPHKSLEGKRLFNSFFRHNLKHQWKSVVLQAPEVSHHMGWMITNYFTITYGDDLIRWFVFEIGDLFYAVNEDGVTMKFTVEDFEAIISDSSDTEDYSLYDVNEIHCH